MKKWSWRSVVLVILAIPLINYMAGYLGRSAAQHVNERESPSASASRSDSIQEVRVVVSSQDSEGVTQQSFDLNFLKNLELYTVERVKQRTKEYMASQGYQEANVDFASEATYVESGSMKLAVIRLRAPGISNQVFVAGIAGGELKRVGCVSNSTQTIPISYGVCADKINEVFGVRIGG